MKLFVLSLLATLAATSPLFATLDTLPPAPELHAALDTFHHRQLMATLAEFDDASGHDWMNWTPSVGVGYAPSGEPRPTASFSLSQVFANLQRRKEKKAKRRSIEEAAKLELAQLHAQLDAMLQQHQLLEMELATLRQIYEIDCQLHSLIVADYEAAKLSPMEYLPKEKAFINARLGVTRKEMELAGLEGEILGFQSFF